MVPPSPGNKKGRRQASAYGEGKTARSFPPSHLENLGLTKSKRKVTRDGCGTENAMSGTVSMSIPYRRKAKKHEWGRHSSQPDARKPGRYTSVCAGARPGPSVHRSWTERRPLSPLSAGGWAHSVRASKRRTRGRYSGRITRRYSETTQSDGPGGRAQVEPHRHPSPCRGKTLQKG